MAETFDAIVIGARCAGSPTALLLARKGYRVLVVDRATFPSDTISTHILHPLAAAALERWGLLARLVATGCPPMDTYTFDFGAFTLAGAPGTPEAPVAYCPRRTILDKLLVDAAADAGAEVRAGFAVEKVWLEPSPQYPQPLRDFLRTVSLGSHLERLPPDLHDPFVDEVARAMEPDPVHDYVRLNITARRA